MGWYLSDAFLEIGPRLIDFRQWGMEAVLSGKGGNKLNSRNSLLSTSSKVLRTEPPENGVTSLRTTNESINEGRSELLQDWRFNSKISGLDFGFDLDNCFITTQISHQILLPKSVHAYIAFSHLISVFKVVVVCLMVWCKSFLQVLSLAWQSRFRNFSRWS